MLLKSCIDCGELSDKARCPEHRPKRPPKATPKARGYDAAWYRLSKRARREQPFCSDCGATDDLTADHLPAAWLRKAEGKTIRLSDVDVVCRSCNAKRGCARPGGGTQELSPYTRGSRQTFCYTPDETREVRSSGPRRTGPVVTPTTGSERLRSQPRGSEGGGR